MSTVTIRAAKTNLSKLIARVEAGEEIVIARCKTRIARLTPIRPPSTARRLGALKGVVSVGPEFFEPLSEAQLGNGDSVSPVAGARRQFAFRRPPGNVGYEGIVICL
jgi:antitoxin (DNA-binding transcriptional repressor) of toxin-antitoxin stability system